MEITALEHLVDNILYEKFETVRTPSGFLIRIPPDLEGWEKGDTALYPDGKPVYFLIHEHSNPELVSSRAVLTDQGRSYRYVKSEQDGGVIKRDVQRDISIHFGDIYDELLFATEAAIRISKGEVPELDIQNAIQNDMKLVDKPLMSGIVSELEYDRTARERVSHEREQKLLTIEALLTLNEVTYRNLGLSYDAEVENPKLLFQRSRLLEQRIDKEWLMDKLFADAVNKGIVHMEA